MKNYYLTQKVSTWEERFLGIAIVLAFLLPHSNTMFLMVNPLLCLMLVIQAKSRRWSSIVFVVLVPIFLSIMLNLGNAQMKAIQSTSAIMLYFACFPFAGKMRVQNGYLYFCLGIIIFSQLVYLFGLPYIGQIMDRIYPIADDFMAAEEYERDNITYATMFDYRLGGLYHNSNQCSRYLTILLAFFLINNRDERMSKVSPFLFLAYFGVLITGSRTGFIIATIVAYFAFFRKRRLSVEYKLTIGVLAAIGFVYFVQDASGTIRGLNIEGGMSGSAGSKWETFLFYLENERSILNLLFGHLDVSLFEGGSLVLNNFDSEYGSLTFRFGLVGLVAVFVFWYMVYKRMDSYNRIFLFNLLWVVSSTMVCSYRAFFVFMLLLSIVYSNQKATPMRVGGGK